MLNFKVKKLSPNATIPTRGSNKAAGYDLSSAYEYTIPAKGKLLCKTDIAIAIPSGHYGRIAPRSGLAHRNFIDVGAGVIDEDYRGNVGVIIFNFSDEDFKVNPGDRIAQLILEKISTPPVQEVEYLDETDRGNDGFGSTGIEKTEKRVQLSQFLNQMDLSKRLDRTKLFCLFCNMLKTRNYRMIDALFPKYDHVNILIAFYLYDQPEYFKKTKLSLQNTHIDFSDFDKCEDELLEFQLENSRVRFLLKNMENESLEDLIGARYRTYDLLNTEYQNLYPWDFNSSILFIRQATPIEVKSVVGKWLEVNRDEWKNIIKQFFQ